MFTEETFSEMNVSEFVENSEQMCPRHWWLMYHVTLTVWKLSRQSSVCGESSLVCCFISCIFYRIEQTDKYLICYLLYFLLCSISFTLLIFQLVSLDFPYRCLYITSTCKCTLYNEYYFCYFDLNQYFISKN